MEIYNVWTTIVVQNEAENEEEAKEDVLGYLSEVLDGYYSIKNIVVNSVMEEGMD